MLQPARTRIHVPASQALGATRGERHPAAHRQVLARCGRWQESEVPKPEPADFWAGRCEFCPACQASLEYEAGRGSGNGK